MTLIANSQKQRLSLASSSRNRPPMPASSKRDHKTELDTRELFGNLRQIEIQHNDETYRLSITKQGKLILTK
ncbi:hemin uptake protein HemP [uncultured Roseibium sp.]|uniref:hemin uptake protein HemP n=1 Tax=uncultured Roseibium sp. TaxID=1936171 RepID=UPI00262FB784|nr:hemin uptake protein HemP [uncultured Roseibium sp.]